jgi:hypothetical protein
VITALLLAGCGGVDAPPSAAEPTGGSEQARSSTPAPEVTASPSAASPQSLESPGATHDRKPGDGGTKVPPTMLPVARPDGSRTHLLAATALPAYRSANGDAGTWTTAATTPEGPRPVGACQKGSMVDIGAVHAVVRTYAGDEGSGLRARQVVARFADAKSAWRAHEVLRAWRDDCEQWLDQPNPEVTPMTDVDTPAGTGHHYRASYGPKKDTDASALGIVRKGRWLSIVAVSEVSSTWTRRAVRRIAATF